MVLMDDKGTKQEILIWTNPSCTFCKSLHNSELFKTLPYTKKIVFTEFNFSEKILNFVLFKSRDTLKTFDQLVNTGRFEEADIDWAKDVQAQYDINKRYNDIILGEFGISSTPSLFIVEDGNIIKPIIIPNSDVGQVLYDAVLKNI